MADFNWRNKKWRSTHPQPEHRKQEKVEQEWIDRFEDPDTTLEEGLGLLHSVFSHHLLSRSPRVIRYVMDIGLWKPDQPQPVPYDREHGAMMVTLREKAFDVFMTKFLKNHTVITNDSSPLFTNDPSIVTDIARFLKIRLPGIKHPAEQYRVKNLQETSERFFRWCLEFGMGANVVMAVKDLPTVEAVNTALPVILEVIITNGLNVQLLQHREWPTQWSVTREELMYAALLSLVTGNKSDRIAALGMLDAPGERLLILYIARRKAELRRDLAAKMDDCLTIQRNPGKYCGDEIALAWETRDKLKEKLESFPNI